MEPKQEFWEGLKSKYEERNKTLQRRQLELRHKLEAMDVIIGDSKSAPDKVSIKKSSIASQVSRHLPEVESEKVIMSQHLSTAMPEFKSCTCQPPPPPAEKGGFFSCLFSAFGSSKPKDAGGSPQTPQTIPTKESTTEKTGAPQDNRPIIGYRYVKNEDCRCDPCAYDETEATTQNDDLCTCSVCSRSCASDEISQNRSNLSEQCICVLPSPEILREGAKPIPDSNSKGSNKTSIHSSNASNGNKQVAKSIFSSPSKLSLKSIDLFYMKNIHDLATDQKTLLKEINDLEQKAQIYDNVFNEYKCVDFKDRQPVCPCIPPPAVDANEKSTAELKLENFLLKNELKDMRLEVRQYLERMEGPMQFKIESERYKCLQLEQKLDEAAKELANIQDLFQKEINSMKLQLCTANANIYELTTCNEQLVEESRTCQEKCAKLEDDLIRQKISEAESIRHLQAALNAQNNANVAKDECNLHQIARELSKVLKECEPCGECMNLPEDLMTAAKLLKSLTDMIDNKLPTSEEQIGDVKRQSVVAKESAVTEKDRESNYGDEVVEKKASSIKQEDIEEAAEIIDALEIIITQQIGGPQVIEKPESVHTKEDDVQPQERTPSIKPESIHTQDRERGSQTEERMSAKPDTQSTASSKTASKREGEEEASVQFGSRRSSVKSAAQETASRKSRESGKSDRRSERSAKKSEGDQRSRKSEQESAAITVQPDKTAPKSKTSCQCVKSKKSTKVDQLWPATDAPVVLKDSSVLETTAVPSKKKCECNVAKKLQEKKLKEARSGSSKGLCKCSKRQTDDDVKARDVVEYKEEADKPAGDGADKPAEDRVDRLWPATSDKFRLSHHVTASKSQDLLKSETSVKCLKLKENFPFDVDTQVDVLNRAPDGVHVTTTITNSGTLEVITEGPEGVIETTLVYTNSGNVEVVTEVLEYHSKGKSCGKSKKLKVPAITGGETPALEAPGLTTSVSEPGKPPETLSGVQVEAPKSGPALNPACKCQVCPVQETIQPGEPEGEAIQEGEPEAEEGQEGAADETTAEQQAEAILEGDQEAAPEQKTETISEGAQETAAEPEEASPVVEGAAEETAEVVEETVPAAAEEPTAVAEDTPAAEVIEVNVEAAPTNVVEAAKEVVDNLQIAKSLSLNLHVESAEQMAAGAAALDQDVKEENVES